MFLCVFSALFRQGVAFLLLLPLCSALHAETRLGLTPARLASVRAAAEDPTDPRHAIYQLLRAPVDESAETEGDHGSSFAAIRAAFLYKLTGEASYARQAYDVLRGVYEAAPIPHEREGRARAVVSLGLAYTWDWARQALSAGERAWLQARVREMLDSWPDYRHEDLAAGKEGDSFTAVCRGSELVLMLAAREEASRVARYQKLKQLLRLHMEGFDEIGVSPEGSAYPADGGPFLLRALLALRDAGDAELEAEAAKHAWWKQAMYAGAFSQRADGSSRNWLMSGSGGPGIGDAGWASLLLGFVPREDLPYFLWWYAHHMGTASPGGEASRYDPHGDGRVWALLLYPPRAPMLDPTGVYGSGIRGAAGQVLLRNRWRNRADIQVSIHAGSWPAGRHLGPPETFSIRVLAHGETWIGGPGGETGAPHFSTLLVDGRPPEMPAHADGENATLGGAIRRAEFWPDGAYVVVDGGEPYRALGASRAERHMLVHFHPASDDLLLDTLDRVESAEPHTYTWQLNLGEPGETRRVARDRRLTPMLNQPFVFLGGGWPLCSVVGEVMDASEDLKMQYQDPIRVERRGTRAEIRMQMSWRCSGGAFAPNSAAMLEFPRLPGEVIRAPDGGLALERPRGQPLALPLPSQPRVRLP